jgi:transcriptional antiterminator Rof (Rho-off)
MSRKTNGNAWNKPIYSLNFTSCLCSDRFIIIFCTQQCSQIYTRTWHWTVHSGLHSYLTLSCAFRFTLVLGTRQCIQVYTRTWQSVVQSGLHSYLTLSCAFRFTLVLDTQQCIQVYTRTWHSLMHSGLRLYLTLICAVCCCRPNRKWPFKWCVCPALADSGVHYLLMVSGSCYLVLYSV